jgi:hypothetical protein
VVHEGLGDDGQQVGDDPVVVGAGDEGGDGLVDAGRRMGAEAEAGVQQVPGQKAYAQGQGGDDLEIDDGLDADAADLAHVAHRADAVDDGAEDHRADHHLDQGDEGVAQGLERLAQARVDRAHHRPDDDGDQHLDVELPP